MKEGYNITLLKQPFELCFSSIPANDYWPQTTDINLLLMKRQTKKSFSLPSTKQKQQSYVIRSIQIAKKGCYYSNKELRIDQGYGDFNMNLFRLRKKRKYVREIPSAFSPQIRELLKEKSHNPREERLTTEHNSAIDKILSTPKEVYLEKIRLEKQALNFKMLEQRRKNEYVKGYDQQIRQYNDHLSFQYLSEHQSNNWFKVKDYSSSYNPPEFKIPFKETFSTPKPQQRKKKGFIFISDRVRKTNFNSNL